MPLVFHSGVYSVAREGKEEDSKKFGFIMGLRAAAMLSDLIILTLDMEATEDSCLSDSISIL